MSIIQGPPGTGKSQTITNIISTALFNRKSVIFIVEKKTAGDVVCNRLEKIKASVLNLLSTDTGKDKFWQSVKDNYDNAMSNNYYDNIDYSDTLEYCVEKRNNLLKKFSDNFYHDFLTKVEKYKDEEDLINLYNSIYADWFFENFDTYEQFEKYIDIKDEEEFYNKISNLSSIEQKKKFIKKHFNKKWFNFSWNPFFRKLDELILEKKNKLLMKKSKRDDFNKITVDNFDELKDYFYFKRNFEKFKSYDNNELSNATAAILSTIKKQKNTVSDKINHFAKENSKIFQQNTKNKAGIYHQLNLQRRKSINFCVTNYKDEIVAGFKCIVTTPELASRFFRHFNFDYVIFDEASQMTKERLFPCLFLGKCKIICGDQKQLPPTSFFSNKFDNEYEETDEQILNEENFITFCDTFENIQNFMLTNHYRSKYSELIEFCNRKIYDGKLNYMNKNAPNDDCIEDCHITNGIWNNGVNEAEANKIVEIVKKICSEENHGTIGIITFNITQKELIFDKLQKCNDKKINEEFLRKNQEGENVSLFVKNLENVQGDERDIIIFSIAFARNLEGKFLQNFGPINAIGGVNRLNVAFSRAKEKMIIVNSINNTEITTENAVNKGRMFFKNFMKYVQSKPHEIDDVVQSNRKHSPESVFEEEVLISLRQYFPHLNFIPQYNCGEYRIDIVVMSDDTPLLAIECDGYRYHSSLDKMREDNERQKDLESVGWKFYRIPSKRWWINWEREKQQKEIMLEIKDAIEKEKERLSTKS